MIAVIYVKYNFAIMITFMSLHGGFISHGGSCYAVSVRNSSSGLG